MSFKGKIRFYKSIDIKLTAWYTLTFLTIIVLVFGFLDYRLGHNLLKEIDRMLVDEVQEIINRALKFPEKLNSQLKEYERSVFNRKYYQIAFQVLDQQGNPIYSSSKLRGFTFPEVSFDKKSYQKTTSKNLELPQRSSPFRLCTYYYEEDGDVKYVIQIVTYLRMMKKTIQNFRRNLTIAFFISFLFGSIGGWLLSRQTLRPIKKITEATKRITATNLSERLSLQGTDDELDMLAETINQMLERLEESFQKLSRFTTDAAHELRTPIAALKGETEVLLSKNRSSKEYREALANNLERLDFLTRLVNDLLLLSQADEGEKSLQIETINLNELLRELWEAFKMVAVQEKINFTFNKSEETVIRGDRIKLKQLFSNLFDNAVKYTPRGGKISLSIHPENEHVRIILSDTGIGIPSEDLPYIFDRFYRVDKSRSRQFGGVGLGLSICKWIVKAHEGTIEVNSQPNRGTTFTITFPTKLA